MYLADTYYNFVKVYSYNTCTKTSYFTAKIQGGFCHSGAKLFGHVMEEGLLRMYGSTVRSVFIYKMHASVIHIVQVLVPI